MLVREFTFHLLHFSSSLLVSWAWQPLIIFTWAKSQMTLIDLCGCAEIFKLEVVLAVVVLAHLNLRGHTGANSYFRGAVKLVSAHCLAVQACFTPTTLMGLFSTATAGSYVQWKLWKHTEHYLLSTKQQTKLATSWWTWWGILQLKSHIQHFPWSSAMLSGAFFWHGLRPLVPLKKRVSANQYKVALSNHLYPMMKHSCDFVEDGNLPIHRAQGVTLWFDEYKIMWIISHGLHGRLISTEIRFWSTSPLSSKH